jgi:hypothetical protein
MVFIQKSREEKYYNMPLSTLVILEFELYGRKDNLLITRTRQNYFKLLVTTNCCSQNKNSIARTIIMYLIS